ncbi:uncharacterized protein LOC119461860 isoform X3 [Dermacentor silvarum]|uniref:uncharacterized protein LOC119461860 isoform X3 n=1 Tax=Dermacentor silvarum TaxID=543639 RepID=UPI0021019093|nr:uncharacterized protein LOC119461860 isoform X3 [Dermacentor silvarum]
MKRRQRRHYDGLVHSTLASSLELQHSRISNVDIRQRRRPHRHVKSKDKLLPAGREHCDQEVEPHRPRRHSAPVPSCTTSHSKWVSPVNTNTAGRGLRRND